MNEQTQPKSVGEEIGGTIGKEIGAEIGKEVERHVTGQDDHQHARPERKKRKPKSPIARRVGYVFGIVFTLIFLWIINNFQEWGWTFITSAWEQVEQIVHISIYLNLIVYALFILYDRKLFYYVGRLTMDGFGIYVGIRMFQVFPFDFNNLFGGWGWLNSVLPWIIILGIVGIGIAIIVRTARLISGKEIYD